MSTEIPVLYNEIRGEFNKAMANANGDDFVERPKVLSSLAKRRREFVQNARLKNQMAVEILRGEANELCQNYPITQLEAKGLVLYAWDIEERLAKEGAIFNNKPFNFSLQRFEISESEQKFIIDSSLEIMNKLDSLGRQNLRSRLSFLPLNPVEQLFEDLNLLPNAARMDFMLTQDGPKIIEINSQWVDAIAALQGFQKVFGQGVYRPIETLSEKIFFRKKVAIINVIQDGFVSGLTGATKELEVLAQKLMATRRPPSRCEVLDPDKTNLEYLSRFDIYYINCDPRYFVLNTPAWIKAIYERVAGGKASTFPSWRPLLDKKFILSELPAPVIPTTQLTKNYELVKDVPVVVKGDGYSLNSVATSLDNNFQDFFEYAKQDPTSYVVQPLLESKRVDSWVYDTGKKKVKFIKDAYTKLNVWVLGDKVVGMLSTLSDSPMISDKGYNSLPIFREEKQ